MRSKYLTQSGLIAAVYVALTLLSSALGLASGQIQLRLGESLCLLPCLLPAAVPGLTVGCLLANLLTGCPIWDVLFGTAATLLGAMGTRALKDRPRLALLPPIGANALIIPQVLTRAYGLQAALPLLTLTVAAGEVLCCGVLGTVVYNTLNKHKNRLF